MSSTSIIIGLQACGCVQAEAGLDGLADGMRKLAGAM